VVELLAEVLTADGRHTCELATGGTGALAVLARGGIDLVVSDVRMPGLDGLGLYREIERVYPQLRRRFVWMTGGSPDPATMKLVKETGLPVLNKPFDIAEVVRVVEAAGA
jgi:DNA-binding NtrC family response regulator